MRIKTNSIFQFPLILTLTTVMLASCSSSNIATAKVDFSEDQALELISEYNAKEISQVDANKARLITGPLETENILDKNGEPVVKLRFLQEVEGRKCEFTFYSDIQLPQKLKNAQVTFLGNQLILNDLKSDFIINLVVPQEGKEYNRTDHIPSVAGNGLGIAFRRV